MYYREPSVFSLFIERTIVMKKICVMMIAAYVLAVSTANTADASLLSKRIDGVKKIAALVGKTFTKTADNAGKIVWNNKGAIAVGTVATVALTNPKAVTAAVTGTADVAYGVVTGGGTTNGKNADTVAQRSNARPSTTGGMFSTLLFTLVMIGLVFIGVKYLLRSSIRRMAVPLLIVGVLLCFGVTAEASMLSSIPDIQCTAPVLVKPVAHFIMLVITIASIFL
jgi:hypothetical protein